MAIWAVCLMGRPPAPAATEGPFDWKKVPDALRSGQFDSGLSKALVSPALAANSSPFEPSIHQNRKGRYKEAFTKRANCFSDRPSLHGLARMIANAAAPLPLKEMLQSNPTWFPRPGKEANHQRELPLGRELCMIGLVVCASLLQHIDGDA